MIPVLVEHEIKKAVNLTPSHLLYCHRKTLKMFEKSSVQRFRPFPFNRLALGSSLMMLASSASRTITPQTDGSLPLDKFITASSTTMDVKFRLPAMSATTGFRSRLRFE